MNFEIKSTFIQILRFSLTPIRFLLSPRNAPYIVLFNITSAVIGMSLYLTNTILPATIGSHPFGEWYVLLIEAALLLQVCTTLYASLLITIRFIARKLNLQPVMVSELLHRFNAVITRTVSRLVVFLYLNIYRVRVIPMQAKVDPIAKFINPKN